MIRFGQTCAAIAARPGKLEKIAILGEYLRSLGDADLQAAARFFTGNAFAARDERSLGIGWRTIVEAAKRAWNIGEGQLAAGYREHGDLGAALGPLVRPPMSLALFNETLTPAKLYKIFEEIAAASGKAAGKKREALCERVLAACTDAVEATYVIKIMTGDLRIGLREGLIIDAIAAAFGAGAKDVRRATMAAGDIGAVAVAARHNRLADLRVAYGSPLGFMLATPVTYGSDYRDLRDGTWIVEEKFDGIRAQVHKGDGTVRIFSRTFSDVTRSYPEIASAIAQLLGNFMLDGEIVARRGDQVLPFRYLQARLQRKTIDDELLAQVPVAYIAFDILARGEEFLIDEQLIERREQLAEALIPGPSLHIASFTRLGEPPAPEELHDHFEAACAQGHEGIMLKRTLSKVA